VNTLWQYSEIGTAQPRESFMDTKGNIWIADFGNGLIQQRFNGSFMQVMPNGPISNRIKSFHFASGKLFAAAGGTDISFVNLYNQAEYSVLKDNEWRSYRNPGHYDYMAAKSAPFDKELIYISSWGSGIFSYKQNEVVSHYDETNSTLQNALPGGPNTRVWGMDFDRDGNLWVSNSNVNNSLSVLKRNGEWVAYPLRNSIGAEILGEVVVDDFNNIWMVLLKGGGLLALNTNNTPDNLSDDQLVKFKPKNAYGQIVSNVYTLVKDLDGNIWAGTDFGPVVYSDPDEVFNGNTDGKQPTLRRYDGTDQVDPLLGSEMIKTIAVDGANRKWIGTERGGAFLVSAEGDSSLLQFNMDNSPILSNSIISIGIHDITGEVFFGTERGIISYRSNATKAGENFGDVYAFPNPVRPGYHGNITITGLIKDANVKITDIAGNLVFETTTLGGQIVWDGNNFDGRRAASGVYIIFCTNSDGSKTYVTKLLFMK
jgi:ligand-binding sensor domain-containing protein